MLPFRFRSTKGDTLVGVLANPSGECEPELLQIEAWARNVGVEVVNLGTSAEPRSLPAGCGLVIALGGDGTILLALQLRDDEPGGGARGQLRQRGVPRRQRQRPPRGRARTDRPR